MQSALPNHSLLLEYCTCHSGLLFQPLEQNVELHVFRISQFACNQISCWQANEHRSSKPFIASSYLFFLAWQWLEREIVTCKVCTGHSLMLHLHPLSYDEHKMVLCLGWNAPCDLYPKAYHLFQCDMWTNRGGTTFSQRVDAKSPKSSTACCLHRWKNHRRARPVAPRKLLEVICGWREHFDSTFAQCSYGSRRWRPDMTSLLISLSKAAAKTDPAPAQLLIGQCC